MADLTGYLCEALGKPEEALQYYEDALRIRKEVGDRTGEGTTLHSIRTLYFEQHKYDIALAFFLLARNIYEDVLSPYRDVSQNWIDDLHEEVGKQQFATLLAQVEPQAHQIVEQALHEDMPHV